MIRVISKDETSFVEYSNPELYDLDLGEGAYLYQFVLTDVLGEEHDTEFYVQHYKADG